MFRASMPNLPRVATRMVRIAAPRTTTSLARVVATPAGRLTSGIRAISSTTPRNIAILPGSDKKPEPKEPAKIAELVPAEITESQYHQLADEYLESILGKFEEMQDLREDVDVEYSVRFSPPPTPTVHSPFH